MDQPWQDTGRKAYPAPTRLGASEAPAQQAARPSIADGSDPDGSFRMEVQRLLASRALRPRPTLRRLLLHLAQAHMERDAGGLKESVIAAQVFGRDPARFDAQRDAIVRVSALRLRNELTAHYAGDGAGSGIAIELHSGSYALQVRRRTAVDTPVAIVAVQPLGSRECGSVPAAAQGAWGQGVTQAITCALATRGPATRAVVVQHDCGDALAEAAAQGADLLLGGTVEASEHVMRIALWVRQAPSGNPAGTCTVTVDRKTLLRAPIEMAAELLAALGPSLGAAWGRAVRDDLPAPESAIEPAGSDRVPDLVHRSRMLLCGGEPAQLQRALHLARDAVARGPDQVASNMGMSRALLALHAAFPAGSRAAALGALRHADAAVRLDPHCAAAHALRAQVLLQVALDPVEARRAIDRARVLGGDDADLWCAEAQWLAGMGRVGESLSAWSEARCRHPLDLGLRRQTARALQACGRHAQALQVWREVAEVEAPSPATACAITSLLRLLGERAAHGAALSALVRQFPEHRLTRHARAMDLLDDQRFDEALALRGGPSAEGTAGESSLLWAEHWLAAGEPDRALQALEMARRRPEPGIHLVQVDPVFEPLRGRFLRDAASGGDDPIDATTASPD